MRSAPQYPIGKPTLTFALGAASVLAGILLVAGLGSATPSAPALVPTSVATSVPASLPSGPATRAPSPIPPGYRLQIPRLGIDLPLAEGDITRDIDLQRTPEGSAFHLPGTAI